MRGNSARLPDSEIRNETFDGLQNIRSRFLVKYEEIPIIELLSEYDERIRVFRKLQCYGEAKILEDGKRIWNELRSDIGEKRFREELIMTIALALHSSFISLVTEKSDSSKNVRKIGERTRTESASLLEP